MRAEWRKSLSTPPVRIFSSSKIDEVTHFVVRPDGERKVVPLILEFICVGIAENTNIVVLIVELDDLALANDDVVLMVEPACYACQNESDEEKAKAEIPGQYVHSMSGAGVVRL